jgi:hypothetical protein
MKERVRDTVEVECDNCHCKFQKLLYSYREAKKLYHNIFCSKKCQGKFKTTSLNLKCEECSKAIVVLKGDYEKSANKRFFCCRSCSAKFNNRIKGKRSEEDKKKIKDGVERYYKNKGIKTLGKSICLVCDKEFRLARGRSKTCCSKTCISIYNYGSAPYTKEDVINEILKIKSETGLTPQKRDYARRLEYAAVRFFGTWNKTMEECGLKPNHSKYQKIRLICKDGHKVDSISEKIIDEWLFGKGIKHEKNKRYPNSNRDCDFYLSDYDIWIEYFGLAGGGIEEYEMGIIEKRGIAEKNNFKILEITPKDLYGGEDYNKILERLIRI